MANYLSSAQKKNDADIIGKGKQQVVIVAGKPPRADGFFGVFEGEEQGGLPGMY